MASNRLELQREFETILGTRNVYFRPPESIKIKYPCIIYDLDDKRLSKADNLNYLKRNRYSVQYIDYNPDSEMPDAILEKFKYSSFERSYCADNLTHWYMRLYF